MNQQLCIFGEVLFDIFPDGEQVLGGAPFNVAWHLQAFAQKPLFISRIGNDRQGEAIRRAMADWGMNTDALQTDPSLPTGRVSITFNDAEPVYDIVSPCAYDAIDTSEMPSAGCKLLYHGSLALRHEQSAHALQQLIDNRPSCLFVDVNLRDPWWRKDRVLKQIERADWVKLNSDEFDLLFPGKGLLPDRLTSFVKTYQLQAAILTRGEKGAEVLNSEAEHFSVRPTQNVEVVDTVGAGDAFTSVMIMGIVNRWPIQTTLQRAQMMASNIVGQRGATIADYEFYQQILAGWQTSKQ